MGQVFSFRVEAIFVGNVVHSVCDAGKWVDKRETAANFQELTISSARNQFCGFLFGLSVGELEAIIVTSKTNIVRRSLFYEYGLLFQSQGACESDSDKGGEKNDLENIKLYMILYNIIIHISKNVWVANI